jgi:hypothetical protein
VWPASRTAGRRGTASCGLFGARRRRRERHAGAASFRESDRDRLLGGSRAVLALSHMMDFLTYECTRLSARRLAGPLIPTGPLNRFPIWHEVPPDVDASSANGASGTPSFDRRQPLEQTVAVSSALFQLTECRSQEGEGYALVLRTEHPDAITAVARTRPLVLSSPLEARSTAQAKLFAGGDSAVRARRGAIRFHATTAPGDRDSCRGNARLRP